MAQIGTGSGLQFSTDGVTWLPIEVSDLQVAVSLGHVIYDPIQALAIFKQLGEVFISKSAMVQIGAELIDLQNRGWNILAEEVDANSLRLVADPSSPAFSALPQEIK